ncbi:unnamed protein product [Penicillium bialowiezense]
MKVSGFAGLEVFGMCDTVGDVQLKDRRGKRNVGAAGLVMICLQLTTLDHSAPLGLLEPVCDQGGRYDGDA